MVAPNDREGITITKLRFGGYLVRHPTIYEMGALYFAATTIDEAFQFIRDTLDGSDKPDMRATS